MAKTKHVQTFEESLVSDRGLKRPTNEDCFGSFRTLLGGPSAKNEAELLARKGRLYVVADGMGGHERGDVASSTAVQQICTAYYADRDCDVENGICRAISYANTAIYTAAQERRHATTRPMGTTVVCAVIHDQRVTIAHVGDSRAYRLRGRVLAQLTSDHDWINEQISMYGISREQAERRARSLGTRGCLVRAVGVKSTVEADVVTLEWQPGDVMLLCSDGLHGLLDDKVIARILRSHPTAAAARALIDAANAAGGDDNVTAVVVGDQPARPAPAPEASRWSRPILASGLACAGALMLLGVFTPVSGGQLSANFAAYLETPASGAAMEQKPTSTLQPTATETQAPSVTPSSAPTLSATLQSTRQPTATARPVTQPIRAPNLPGNTPLSRATSLPTLAPSATARLEPSMFLGGGAGDLFRGEAYRGKSVAAAPGITGSCIQGRLVAADGSWFKSFYVQADRRGTTKPAQHDYESGNFRICGLAQGDWGVAVYAVENVPISVSEQAKHQVRVRLSGKPDELVVVNFRATSAFAPAPPKPSASATTQPERSTATNVPASATSTPGDDPQPRQPPTASKTPVPPRASPTTVPRQPTATSVPTRPPASATTVPQRPTATGVPTPPPASATTAPQRPTEVNTREPSTPTNTPKPPPPTDMPEPPPPTDTPKPPTPTDTPELPTPTDTPEPPTEQPEPTTEPTMFASTAPELPTAVALTVVSVGPFKTPVGR